MALENPNISDSEISSRNADLTALGTCEALSAAFPLLVGKTHAAKGPSWVFQQWFAWYPVWPEDERGIFWLETVWIRYDRTTKRWRYRSFRTEEQRQAQLEREYPYGF